MQEWTNVVTDPLGIAAFSVFLVFNLLGLYFIYRKNTPKLIARSAVALAFIGLLGGLTISFYRVREAGLSHQLPANLNQQSVGTINQRSSGNASTNVVGVQGNVTVNNNSGNSAPPKKEPKSVK